MRKVIGMSALLIAALCSGCITTSMQGYADRELPTKPIQHIVAYVAAPVSLATKLQSSIAEESAKRGITAEDALGIFPPTRTYSNADIKQGLAQNRIDAVLVIDVGDTGVIREYAGTYFQSQSVGTFAADGTADRFGNTTNISMTGTSYNTTSASATPMYRYNRKTAFNSRLVEASTGRTLWVGSGQVSAGGLLFVGDGASASSSMSAIFDDLQRKGLMAGAHS